MHEKLPPFLIYAYGKYIFYAIAFVIFRLSEIHFILLKMDIFCVSRLITGTWVAAIFNICNNLHPHNRRLMIFCQCHTEVIWNVCAKRLSINPRGNDPNLRPLTKHSGDVNTTGIYVTLISILFTPTHVPCVWHFHRAVKILHIGRRLTARGIIISQ